MNLFMIMHLDNLFSLSCEKHCYHELHTELMLNKPDSITSIHGLTCFSLRLKIEPKIHLSAGIMARIR